MKRTKQHYLNISKTKAKVAKLKKKKIIGHRESDIRLMYANDYTQAYIAKYFNMTRANVGLIINAFYKK